jgi:putative copper export protein
MAPFDIHIVRLFLHVLAATIWVGGQFTLAGLVPTARSLGEDAPKKVARAFNRMAWPAFGVLVATGVWNLMEVDVADRPTRYHMVLGVKLLAVAASGIGAGVHIVGRSKAALAVGGSLAGLGAVVALFCGVWISG